jgi:aspartate kinase
MPQNQAMMTEGLHMGVKVAKFGGSSLASAGQFEKVLSIIRADTSRIIIVPSAPGKRGPDDTKVTDLLYDCHSTALAGGDVSAKVAAIQARYGGIVTGLGMKLDLSSEFETMEKLIRRGASADYCASRGEYFSGIVLAAALGFEFIDAADCIFFREDGMLDEERTNRALGEAMAGRAGVVLPGFYGSMPDGKIRTFSRGGSDITGALAARAAGAKVYENWTDVSGVLAADPRIVPHARTIGAITYRELRELSYMGATVLHEDAIFPVRKAGIPICIRNTNAPDDRGTVIMAEAPEDAGMPVVTGIAGRKGFSVIGIEKAMMNSELGFGRKILSVLEDNCISFEHLPTGIDTLSVVVESRYLEGKRQAVIAGIRAAADPDDITIIDGMALIATVGRGMVHHKGTAARLFGALAGAGINISLIDQGSSELNIIVGVEEEDFEGAIRAIYRELVV